MANTQEAMRNMTRETEQMMPRETPQTLTNGWPLRYKDFPAKCTKTLANNAKGQQGHLQEYYACDPDRNQCARPHKTAAEATLCAQKRLEKQGLV